MTTKKIGDGFVALSLLFFIVGLFSYLFINLDASTGLDSGRVNAAISNLEGNLSDVKSAQSSLIDKTDKTSNLAIEDATQLIENRGSDAAGFMNIISKNVLTRFFETMTNEIDGSSIILTFLLTLVSIIFSILILRFFWGDSKV